MYERKRSTLSKRKIIAIVAIFLLLVAGGYVYCVNTFGIKHQTVRGILEDAYANFLKLNINGESYLYKRNLTNILVLGIDKQEKEGSIEVGYRTAGQLTLSANKSKMSLVKKF